MASSSALLDLESGWGPEQFIYSNTQQASVEHLLCVSLDTGGATVNKIGPKSLPSSPPSTGKADTVNGHLSHGVKGLWRHLGVTGRSASVDEVADRPRAVNNPPPQHTHTGRCLLRKRVRDEGAELWRWISGRGHSLCKGPEVGPARQV